MSSAANQKWARFPHRGTIPVQTYANLFASPIIHLYGRKIFRPGVGHWWRLTACLFLPRNICGTGEIFFAPTLALGTPSPDHHPNRCQSSICSQTFSHTRSSIVWAKYFSPKRRPLVARNRLNISAAHHLLHRRNIFRPYDGHCYPVARSPPQPLPIINMFANLFAYPIIHCRGEIFFAQTSAIGGA